MKLKILQTGEPVLRKTARELTIDEIHSSSIQQLISLMLDTLRDAPGVGLAAPQIGESIQLIVIEDREEYHKALTKEQLAERQRKPIPFHVLINPKISLSHETVAFYEGCLSLTGLMGVVPRALSVQVEALNQGAEPISIHAQGWYARILQHEIDHLHGHLCIDHMQLDTLTTFDNYTRYWK